VSGSEEQPAGGAGAGAPGPATSEAGATGRTQTGAPADTAGARDTLRLGTRGSDSPADPAGARDTLRLGTRGSPLALRQAQLVAEAIVGANVEIVVLRTGGDLGESGDKRRWVDTIEAALLDRTIDLAVHSAKDLPAELGPGLEIAGAPAREDARDALCGALSVASLPVGARVGTSSLRRRAQLLALRDDITVEEVHGNVDTRLGRLAAGDFDAIVLAAAGLSRLGRSGWRTADELVPAAGQGILAIETRAGDPRVASAIASLRDAATERALAAERALVRDLGAGCDTPVGAHARELPDGRLALRAFVGAPDGSEWIRDALTAAEEPVALGEMVAQRLLACGAGALLG
jgi:hydroxymethylbilane synthase